jgi:hypothetical protein
MSLVGKGGFGMRGRSRPSRPGVVGRFAGRAGRAALGLINPRTGKPFRRRGRGISATELRGFRKVARLLRMVGMRPRGLGPTRHRHKVTSI